MVTVDTGARKIDCPHCTNPYRAPPSSKSHVHQQGENSWNTLTYVCPSCEQITLVLQKLTVHRQNSGRALSSMPIREIELDMMVYPRNSKKEVPSDVPGDIAEEFKEAAAVLETSPKASAALSRRIMQSLFHKHLCIKKKDLNAEIDEFVATSKPPSYIAGTLHALRELGNNAAHPRTNTVSGEIIEVEPGEAEYMLDAIEALFDFIFVQPARQAAMKDKLNSKLSGAGKKPIK